MAHASGGPAAEPTITVAPVTVANWQTCIHLRVSPEQATHLASNLYSLAEAYVEPACVPRAIYADETMIGFVMYTFHESTGAYSIPRFMIDVHWQGAGYGRRAMAAVLDTLKAERPAAPVFISLTPGNAAARRLYTALGFEETGRREAGEDILCHR